MKIMKIVIVLIVSVFFGVFGFAQQKSTAEKWEEKWTETTGANWRTKVNSVTGQSISYDTKTSELWRNPVTGKTEAVLIERAEYQNSNVAENPVLPSEAADWSEKYNSKSSGTYRTYENSKTGETVSADIVNGEFWRNPVTGETEVVLKERVQKSAEEASRKAKLLAEERRKQQQSNERSILEELKRKSENLESWNQQQREAARRRQDEVRAAEEQRQRALQQQRENYIRQQNQYTPSYNGPSHGYYYHGPAHR